MPTKRQLEFLNWEFGVFFHFGIRSFFKGHTDWDGKEMPLDAFDPDKLYCIQWLKTVKEAGARYAILTTKHHDGFALWPTKYSSYSVKNTPWKDGHGDVVFDFVSACRQYDIKVGLYYSPAQWGNEIEFKDGKEYDDYFIGQISELLTNYGKIDYLWFDGCGSEGHQYDKERIVKEIFRLQPDILTFCDPGWFPCVRWIGNEDGYASLDNPLVVSSYDFSEKTKEEMKLDEVSFLPSECDCRIRASWFYDDNLDTLKTTEELFGMYESSVGHGSNFLLNIGPNYHGLIPEPDRKRILELGDMIRKVYSTPDMFSDVTKDKDTYTVSINDEKDMKLINRIVLMEDISGGQSVDGFEVYCYLPTYKHKKILVYAGKTIGHKMICPILSMKTPKIEVVIKGSDGEHKLTSIQGYHV